MNHAHTVEDVAPRSHAAMSSDGSDVLRFEPWQSAVDPGFWAELARRKLDNAGLSEDPWTATALYAPSQNAVVSSPAQLTATSFGTLNEDELAARQRDMVTSGRREMPGVLVNVNTLERFRAFDRGALMATAAKRLVEDIKSGKADTDPGRLTPFIALTFADLKKWSFYYWFAFPALKLDTPAKVQSRRPLMEAVSDADLAETIAGNCDRHLRDGGDAVWFIDDASGECQKITDEETNRRTVAVLDPCANGSHPGWALRNVLTWLAIRRLKSPPSFESSHVRVLSVRKLAGRVCPKSSIVFECVPPVVTESDLSNPRGVGWEVNEKGRSGPRLVDLGTSMDPTRLASQAVDLNLKLMRWRLLPQLRQSEVASTKCLLLGAGTLGCAVARCLLGWGVRRVTFVDGEFIFIIVWAIRMTRVLFTGGDVSFSNPVRQSLFEFDDCLDGGKPKAAAAAEKLRRIFPGVEAKGVRMMIPMPGHPVAENDLLSTMKDVETLESLIDDHDCVYLLTDTRESRWLPTLMCAAKGKLLINAALGFDSYLVMRHGGGFDEDDKNAAEEYTEDDSGGAFTGRLGCYFCNDVTAPTDSTSDRTLDQQCTVTRPGLAPIAGALAVEMMVAMCHSDRKAPGTSEPAHTHESFVPGTRAPTALGIIPHQIRGGVFDMRQRLFAAPAFPKCVACSGVVCEAFVNESSKSEFLRRAFDDPSYLENATGLTAMKEAVDDDVGWLSDDSGGDDF